MVTITMKIDPTAQEFPYLRPLVERASEWLEPILRDSPEPIAAEWTAFYDDHARQPRAVLRFEGMTPAVHASRLFSPTDMSDPDRFEFRGRQLYLDLLRNYSKRLLERLSASTSEE